MVPPAGTIYSANLDGSSPQNLFPLNNLGPVRGLAVDAANKKIYWSDSTNHRIRRANFDGSGAETVIGGLTATPGSLALDPGAGKVYWCSETPLNEILRANFDGTGLETLVTVDVGKRGIALDLINNKMYWIAAVVPNVVFRRANLDGTGLETITIPGLDTPNSLGLDVAGNKMYWTDFALAEIHRANLDGTSPELLFNGAEQPHSISLDVAGGKMYWSDLDDGNLFRANLDGSSVETLTSALPNRPEFLGLFISGSATTFAGMSNTSLGGASMSLDLNNDLVISNIGLSGNDGVSFALGQAQFGEVDMATLALSPGAFVQASAIGSLNNVPGQTLGRITLTGTSGGNTNIHFDLSAVGAVSPSCIVYNGATQVFLGVVPGNSVEVAGAAAPCVIPAQAQGANVAAEVRLNQKHVITIPGGPTVTGDRIIALAENVPALPDYVSDIRVTGGNGLSAFTLTAEELGQFGFLHEAAGAAQINAAIGEVTVSNIGSSLLDGVHIDVEEAGGVAPCLNVGLTAVPLSGVNEQVHFEAAGPISGTPAVFGAIDLLATGSGFDVNVDYAAIGVSMVEVRVFNAGVPVGSAIVPAGNVGTITSAANPIALTRTFVEAAGLVNPCFFVGFQHPVRFAFANTVTRSPAPLWGDIAGTTPNNRNLRSDNGTQTSVHATAPRSPSPLWADDDAQTSVHATSPHKGAGLQSSVIGDEIHFHSVNPTTHVSGISRVTLLMANVPQFTIINEATEAPSPRVFVSKGAITIDRSKHSASKGDLHSNATITFKKGDPTTFTGNLSAVGKITINKENTIVGNAASASAISVASGATITGTRSPNDEVVSIPISVASFSAGGSNITVPKNGTRTLNPGSYGNVILNNSAKLNLSSGEYRFVKLETGSSCFLNFEVSNGGVQVKVTTSLKFGSDVTVTITPGGETNSSAVDFISLQSTQVLISKEGYVLGTITAPNAEVYVSKNTSLRGAIAANKITVDRDVIFWHHSIAGTLPVAKLFVDEEEADIDQSTVTSYQLEQNYPNPFNPTTTISFALPEAGEVSLSIFNMNGQLVKKLIAGEMNAGRHSLVWDATDDRGQRVASGVYLYVIKAGDPSAGSGRGFTAQRKLLLMK